MASDPEVIAILAIDDHPLTVSGIQEVLTKEFGNVRVDSSSTAASGLEQIWARSYNLVLLDLSLGGRNGLEVLEEIKKHTPDTPVLIVSMHPEELYAVRALKAGASGYLRKDSSREEVVSAVRKVLGGEKYISHALAQNMAGYIANESSGKPGHEKLSRREFEVLCLIGKGMGMKQIAGQLNLSIKTVSTYRARLIKELNLTTTASLIRYCIENKLADE
jgi:two-component system, NarL family, invasion response regulator UvrY